MKDYKLTGWQDFWKIFDELIDHLAHECRGLAGLAVTKV